MPGIEAEQEPLHPGLVLRAVSATHRHDQPPGAARGQVVDPGQEVAAQLLVVRVQADDAPPVTDERG